MESGVPITNKTMSYDRAKPIRIAGQRNVGTWRVNSGIKVTRRSDGNALHRSIRWADSVELKMTRTAIVGRWCPIGIENPDGAIHVVIRQAICFYVHASGEVNLGVDLSSACRYISVDWPPFGKARTPD